MTQYGPQEYCKENSKKEFYCKLEEEIIACQELVYLVVIQGDINVNQHKLSVAKPQVSILSFTKLFTTKLNHKNI